MGPESLVGMEAGWGAEQNVVVPPAKSHRAKPRPDSLLSEGRKVWVRPLHNVHTCWENRQCTPTPSPSILQYQTISRVRTFEVDGQVMTSTIRRIVDPQGNEIDNNKRFQLQRCVCESVCVCVSVSVCLPFIQKARPP